MAALRRILDPNNLMVVETGTAQTGIQETKYPVGVIAYTQTVFGSIRYVTGASVGVFLARREKGGINRNILMTIDGSLQLTVQGFSDLLRHGLKPIMQVKPLRGLRISITYSPAQLRPQ